MNDTNSLKIKSGGKDYADHDHAVDPDTELYDDLRFGDGEKAVRELGLRLKKFICKKCPDFSGNAEEIVVDILERVYERIETFQHQSKFYTWVSGIAINVLFEQKRFKGKQAQFTQLTDDLISDRLDPEQQLMEKLTDEINQILVKEALLTLTDRQRGVFEYSHTTDLTSAEIGEKLGISAGAVRSALVDAHAGIERWRKKKGY